jgi:NAD(P)-dependent dehydrogenase (short-subunit alcohol dehydrogenase family)
MRQLVGKVAFITGATGSIGSAIAQLLYESGVDVALGYLQATNTANEMLSSWGRDKNCISIKCDVSNRKSVVSAFQKIHEKYGRIDYLVNNAAYTEDVPIEDIYNINPDIVDKILDINIKGALWCCLEALKYMNNDVKVPVESKSEKSVVNVCSNSIKTLNASNIIYISSKAALQSITESLAVHYGKQARFNAVAPGLIYSNLTNNRYSATKERVLKNTPTGTLPTPQDVAKVVKMLLMGSPSINGQTIYVDGGRTVGS